MSDFMTTDPVDKIISFAAHRDQHVRATKIPPPVSSSTLLAAPAEQNLLLSIPQGFELRVDGIHMAVPGRDDEINDLHLCGPIAVVASARTMSGKSWSKLIRFVDRDGEVREEIFAEAELLGNSKAVLKRLVDSGFYIARDRVAAKGLLDRLVGWDPKKRIVLTERLGWVDEKRSAFVLGTGQVIGDGDFRPIFAVSPEHVGASQPSGGLEDWQQTVAALCVGNPLMIAAVSLALAGPLFDALKIESGGLHLRGASSSGKSTLQRLACSVWGSSDLKRSWNGTRTGFEAVAARCNGTILVLDELAEVSPHDVGEMIYMLGNGSGRQRGTTLGAAQASARWRLPILSSGEISVGEHMASAGKTKHAGIEMRLLDIPADTGAHRAFDSLHHHLSGSAFARAVDDAVSKANGTAGPAFVEALHERGEKELSKFAWFERQFNDLARKRLDISEDPQIQRTMTTFAVIGFAGEVATNLGVTGWPTGTALKAAIAMFKLWLAGRVASTRSEIDEMLAPLRDYVAMHGASDFIDLADPQFSEQTVNSGWKDDKHYYFTASEFTRACLPNERQDVIDVLARLGHLKTNNDSSKGKQFKMPRCVPDRPLVYAVARVILEKSS